MDDIQKKQSRRTFFERIALLGAGAVAGAGVFFAGSKYENAKDPKSKVRVLTSDNKVVEVDPVHLKPVPGTLAYNQLKGREGIKGRRWVMVIDLAKCRNARKCISACQNAHELKPDQYHINVLQVQATEKTVPYNMPKPCQHCDNPPCVSVCPVHATFKRQDGIVLIDNERCIGCRFCMAACPYSARIFHWTDPKKPDAKVELVLDKTDGLLKKAEERIYDVELNVPQRKGTISKCLFSADRLRENKLPYCTEACPNGVYWFGDENEDSVTNGTTKETARLSELIKTNGGYQLMPELGTKPRVYYLPPKNRLFPFEKAEDPIEKQES